jgi:uncharacterized delta-60 repeat protein
MQRRSARRRFRSLVSNLCETLESRRLYSGTLDPNFAPNSGTPGVFLQQYGDTNDALAVAPLPSNGGYIAVGDKDSGNKDFLITKFLDNGTPDSSFGTNGVVSLDLGADEIATSVMVRSDGKILVGGFTGDTGSLSGDMFIGRLNPNGTWDTTFNSVGYRVINPGSFDSVTGIYFDPATSKTTVIGPSISFSGGGIAMARLNGDGSLDSSFGNAGIKTINTVVSFSPFIPTLGATYSNGNFFVPGFTLNLITQGTTLGVAKVSIDGTLASSFGSGGFATASFGKKYELGTTIAIDPNNGNLYVAGTSADGSIELSPGIAKGPISSGAQNADFAVAAFMPSGTLNTAFNTNGKLTIDFGGTLDGASSILLQADGKLIASGGAQRLDTGDSDFATVRINANGTLDATWGTAGKAIFDLGASDGAFGAILDFAGRLILAGHKKFGPNSGGTGGFFALLRVLTANTTLPGLSVSNVSASQATGQVSLNFTVTLSASSNQTVTVNFATADGTAVAPTDYTAANGTLTFTPGDTQKTVTVTFNGNLNTQTAKTLALVLSTPNNATLSQATGTATINPVAIPTLSVNDVTAQDAAGNLNLVFTVTLSAASANPVTVNFATANGTALAGINYVATFGLLTFAPGDTTKTVTVTYTGTGTASANKTLSLVLTTPNNATLARASGTATVTPANVVTPQISIGNITGTNAAGQINLNFTVVLSASTTRTVTVHYATADGTAVAPANYTAASGDLTFAPGETQKTLTIVYNGSATDTATRTLTVNLSSPTNATLFHDTGSVTLSPAPQPTNQAAIQSFTIMSPSTVVGGVKAAATATLVIKNNSQTAALKGNLTLAISGTLAPSTLPTMSDPVFARMTKAVNIKANGTFTLKIPLTFPKVTADNPLFPTLVLTGTGVTNPATLMQSADIPIQVNAQHIILVGPNTDLPAIVTKKRTIYTVKIPITNNGNVTAKGTIHLDRFLTTDGTLSDAAKRFIYVDRAIPINIPAGKTVIYSVQTNTTVINGGGDISAGQYFFVASIRSTNLIPDNEYNGTLLCKAPLTLNS